jgi:alpha-mannosidase
MPEIETLYVVNHTHTDIGFTDYQDVCFRQHGEFIDQALDLIEETADYPDDSRYRWVCEVTGPLLSYLRSASHQQLDRFRHWHHSGAIDVAAMQYNLTPLLNLEQLHRSLYPVRALREDYGLTVRSAMQDDVNGVSWLFADLLPQIGVDFLTLAINQVRGRAPRPLPGAFWWEGPAGGRILVWNGFHYLFGRSMAKLGDWRLVDDYLPRYLAALEERDDYPFDMLYCEATQPMRVDNGPPDRRIVDFARRWNEEGRRPRIVFTTPSSYGERVAREHGEVLETRRGDWTDWWTDGVGSSAYETGLNRTTHELLLVAEAIASWLRAEGSDMWDAKRATQTYEQSTLYDEHTWGAFSSIAAPESLFTKAQWNRKASFAYSAAMETHDVLARAARAFAAAKADGGPQGMFNLGDLPTEHAYPPSGSRELLVINTLPWPRSVLVEEPELRAGGAPVGVLEQFFPRGVPWGGPPHTPLRRVRADLPGFGYSFVPLDGSLGADDLSVGPNLIENRYYRVEIDPDTGGITSWTDKELGHDFANTYRGWRSGQYVYERVDSPAGRDALYVNDFSRDDFGEWKTNPPLMWEAATECELLSPTIEEGRAAIDVVVRGPGIREARCRYSVETDRRVLSIDWSLEKIHVTEPESVYVVFPFNLGEPSFRLDLNGVPASPDADQLAWSARDWFPIRRWVDVSDNARGVTIAPLDAPLVQLGGITTGKAAERLKPEGSTIVSWALNNHWMVNFKASQGGFIPLRYRLTTHVGPCHDGAAGRFAAMEITPPVVLRDYIARGPAQDRFVAVPSDCDVEVTAKPADDGDGVIIRISNLRAIVQTVPLEFVAATPASVCRVTPVETDTEEEQLRANVVGIVLGPNGTESLRARF